MLALIVFGIGGESLYKFGPTGFTLVRPRSKSNELRVTTLLSSWCSSFRCARLSATNLATVQRPRCPSQNFHRPVVRPVMHASDSCTPHSDRTVYWTDLGR